MSKHNRIEYVPTRSVSEVTRWCPWAVALLRVPGGWLAIESVEDVPSARSQLRGFSPAYERYL